ncbi:MAG TPA: MFS transporter [Chitinophagaceae bacterium]|nr:MFS transporter [Chitinophagaceae bacterium]
MEQLKTFTPYQKWVIALIALTQFSVILDFMVISPLGDMLMKEVGIVPKQFGLVVSAYAFSAGISGFLTAGFADRFDRKKLLLFFYSGFIVGTILCGLASNFHLLLIARIITGVFGGVIGSISMAIITDLFSLNQRGRVMGFVQMGLGASQVMGIPISLFLANHWGWQSPFFMVAGLAIVVGFLFQLKIKPVDLHLELQKDRTALKHLWHTIAKKNHRIGFAATALLSIGGFMMMPFGSAFAINNLKITPAQLPLLFMVAGVGSLFFMPILGKLSDKMDKYKLFTIASIYTMFIVVLYTNLSTQPLWIVMMLNVLMMGGILGRMVPSVALSTAIPEMADRGAFMSINTSVQQIAGGIAATVAGFVVVQKTKYSPLEHYNTLGYIIVVISCICLFLMYRVSRMVKAKSKTAKQETMKATNEI